MRAKRTGEALVQMGAITKDQLEVALTQQRILASSGRPMRIGEILIRNRFVRREDIAVAVDMTSTSVGASDVSKALPQWLCAKLEVVAIKTESGTLWVKSARPLGAKQIDLIKSTCDIQIDRVRVIATDQKDIALDLNKFSTTGGALSSILIELRHNDSGQILRSALNALYAEALANRASDIHLDRKDDINSWISHRVDGRLIQKHLVPSAVMSAICTRLKSEAGMDSSNIISPQDGRTHCEYQGRQIDFRVASQPLADGETLAIRVLDAEALPGVRDMFPNQPKIIDLFDGVSNINGKKGGVILVTGPTGAGKTTTLYALIRSLHRDKLNLMTVEDPVEYSLPFARQIQLNQLLGQEAADFERSLLRQDPDIIMMGEIRDAKSASAAMKFAESGHMVFATMHSNSAIHVFDRIASFFEGVAKGEYLQVLAQHLYIAMHQTLSPRLCGCAKPIGEEEQKSMIASGAYPGWMEVSPKIRKAIGCEECGGSGYSGRVMIHETMVIPKFYEVRKEVIGLLSGGIVNAGDIPKINGVDFISKHETSRNLLGAGVLDPDLFVKGSG